MSNPGAFPALATPVIWYPGQEEGDFNEQIELMMDRSYITDDFLAGRIPADYFLDYIAQDGLDPLEMALEWDEWLFNGISRPAETGA